MIWSKTGFGPPWWLELDQMNHNHLRVQILVPKQRTYNKNLSSNLLDIEMRHLQEQVKKAFCYQKLFFPFTVWISCSSDLKFFSNSRPQASNFKFFSKSLQFFLTVAQNNFGNKIPFLIWRAIDWFLSYETCSFRKIGLIESCL